MTRAEVLLVGVANAAKDNSLNQEQLDEYKKAADDAFTTILDRIFIVDAISRTQLTGEWGDVQTQFLIDHDANAAGAKYAEIKAALINLATNRKKSLRLRLMFWRR